MDRWIEKMRTRYPEGHLVELQSDLKKVRLFNQWFPDAGYETRIREIENKIEEQRKLLLSSK